MGDFVEEEYPDHSYLLDSHLLPNQTAEILAKIMEHHREHVYVLTTNCILIVYDLYNSHTMLA